ncbi:hypothetical protein [Streptomyces sp. NPDC088178]|uniref:hypothetical protein n=1 Tax=Streptomyces sp. NPDC088178 TaxID=3365836 RepID=UPI003824402B
MADFLTLDQVLTDGHGTQTPATEFVGFLADYGDLQLFIGHIDAAEANRRLSNLDDYLSGPMEVAGPVTHKWVLFQRHDDACQHRNPNAADDFSSCDCGDFDWHPNTAGAETPGAVAVTTVFADETEVA